MGCIEDQKLAHLRILGVFTPRNGYIYRVFAEQNGCVTGVFLTLNGTKETHYRVLET